MTYLTNCGDQSCGKYNLKGAEWFKIEEAGRTADGTWAQATLLHGAAAEVTIPSNLAAGNYIICHEIIALQGGQAEGGAGFYASCTQLKVRGSGTGTPPPPSSDLVQLPNAYSDTDPGILVDVYSNTKALYTFPSPAVVDLVGSNSSPSAFAPASSAAPASASSAASTIASTPSATSTRKHSPSAIPTSTSTSKSESQGSCKLTLPTDTLTKRETRPRHVSRIM
ncbi:glycosyl hydrolase family 61-domain-containing protein [Armillaria nabsnona]|nr:glycosyl hydrolase family 61-domain-containing protein [Armillaria nabsnona]